MVRVGELAGYWPTTELRVEVTSALHQTVSVSFGYYRPPVIRYMPMVLR